MSKSSCAQAHKTDATQRYIVITEVPEVRVRQTEVGQPRVCVLNRHRGCIPSTLKCHLILNVPSIGCRAEATSNRGMTRASCRGEGDGDGSQMLTNADT